MTVKKMLDRILLVASDGGVITSLSPGAAWDLIVDLEACLDKHFRDYDLEDGQVGEVPENPSVAENTGQES